MAFKQYDEFEKQRAAEIKQRGYDAAELKKIKEKLKNERQHWRRRFETFTENMLYHTDSMSPADIARYARDLADAEFVILKEKFDDEATEEDD